MWIDGEVCDLFDLLFFDLYKKYIIEVVVDCFKVCDDMVLCLVELFEMVFSFVGGNVVVVDMDDKDVEEIVFFVNFVCLYCGYSISELELCLFLFNNLVGVCFICDGLGIR